MKRNPEPTPSLAEQLKGVEPARPSRIPRQRRRSAYLIAFALTAAGAIAGAQIVAVVGDRHPVLVAARDVPAGRPLANEDFTVVKVATDGRIAAVPASRRQQIIGFTSPMDLKAGMLLPPGLLAAQQRPGPGQQVVPVAVKQSRLPARGLKPNDQVMAVPTPEAGKGDLAPIAATVDKVSAAPDNDGLFVIDLVVEASDGPTVAQHAADNAIALVLTPRK